MLAKVMTLAFFLIGFLFWRWSHKADDRIVAGCRFIVGSGCTLIAIGSSILLIWYS